MALRTFTSLCSILILIRPWLKSDWIRERSQKISKTSQFPLRLFTTICWFYRKINLARKERKKSVWRSPNSGLKTINCLRYLLWPTLSHKTFFQGDDSINANTDLVCCAENGSPVGWVAPSAQQTWSSAPAGWPDPAPSCYSGHLLGINI